MPRFYSQGIWSLPCLLSTSFFTNFSNEYNFLSPFVSFFFFFNNQAFDDYIISTLSPGEGVFAWEHAALNAKDLSAVITIRGHQSPLDPLAGPSSCKKRKWSKSEQLKANKSVLLSLFASGLPRLTHPPPAYPFKPLHHRPIKVATFLLAAVCVCVCARA